MFIIVRFEITDRHRKALAQVLGQKALDESAASRDLIRDFMQRQGEQTLNAIAMPLPLAGAAPVRAAQDPMISTSVSGGR